MRGGLLDGTAPADVDRAGFRPDAGIISKPASKRLEATHSATAPSKRAGKGAGQTGRAARTSAVEKHAAAGRSGRSALPDHKPPVEAPTPLEKHAAAELRGGGKRKRAPSAEPPAAAPKGKQGRAAAAHVAEPAQKRSRAAEEAQPAKQGKPAVARAKAAAPDTQHAELTAKVQPPTQISVPASAASAAEQTRRAARVPARSVATAKAKPKARSRGTASEQTALPDDAAQTAAAPGPAAVQLAAVDVVPKAVEANLSEPAPAAEAAEAPTESPRKRGRVPSKRIAALQGSPGLEDAPASHKRPADDGGGCAPLESRPSSPRGAAKSGAKRSKRQQLDDEVVKAKYMADLKQYVEERGMVYQVCGLTPLPCAAT